MEPEVSLQFTLNFTIRFYPEEDKTSPDTHVFSLPTISISSFHRHLYVPSGFFLQVSRSKLFTHFLSLQSVVYASPILLLSVW